jgi:hypothetical protein
MDLVGLVGDFLGRCLIQRRRLIAHGRIVGGIFGRLVFVGRVFVRRSFVGGLDAERIGNRLDLVRGDRLVGHAGHHFAQLVDGVCLVVGAFFAFGRSFTLGWSVG